MADFIIIAVIAIAMFFAVRKTVKTKGCAGCKDAGCCSGTSTGSCPSANSMVEDIEKQLETK